MQGSNIKRFIDHYTEPVEMPEVTEEVISSRPLDSLSPTETNVVSNQDSSSEPSPAMQRTFDLQEEINRKRKKANQKH